MSNLREHLRCSRRGCSYSTNRSYNLERHERNHDKGKVPVSQCQPCPHCSYAAGSVHNLMRHIGKKHAILSVNKQKGHQPEQLKELQPKEQSTKVHIVYKKSKTEEKTADESLTFNNGTALQNPSLWHWSSPQQQEKNFLRRSALVGECKILNRTVKTFKLYSLVMARGGAFNVDRWEHVAAALGFPSGSGRHIRAKYMDILHEFEQSEEDRLKQCESVEGVPSWWDDGDYIADDANNANTQSGNHRPSNNARNAIVKMIFDMYYLNHLKNSKPLQRFRVKDSWLCATNLNYQALICQMHFKHYTDP